MGERGSSVLEISKYVAIWENEGQRKCLQYLAPYTTSLTDPDSQNILSEAFSNLLLSALATFTPTPLLSVVALSSFLESLLRNAPTSSSSQYPIGLAEISLDAIWALDSQLDEVLQDAKTVLEKTGQDRADTPPDEITAARQAKENMEKDRTVLAEVVKYLAARSLLPLPLTRERLGISLLCAAGLVADEEMFGKKEPRTRTTLFYKQTRFNLLREQSEGYSKLTTEIFSMLGPQQSTLTALPAESMADVRKRARLTWNKIVSLIGYFDLDPNRALDIILDLFSSHVQANHVFFLELIRCSPWTRAPKMDTVGAVEVNQRSESRMDTDPANGSDEAMYEDHPPPSVGRAMNGMYAGKSFDDVLRIAELGADLPDPPASDEPCILGQILGFKFAYYQHPDVSTSAPKNLYFAAALLIREGFIRLSDLYPHLSPTDKDMPKVYERYQETIKTKMEAAKRASGPVMGGELEPRGMQRRPAMETKKTEESKKPAAQSSHPPNQKIGILKALLSVGALRPAFFILSKFPWMVSNHLDVSDLLLRILRVAIEPLYSPYSYSNRSGLENATTSKTAAHAMDSKPRKSVLTAWAPLPPPTATTDFVFFYVGWERWIPVCTTREELISVCEPFMRYTGVHLYRDIGFLTRLLRIGKAELQEVARTPVHLRDAVKVQETFDEWENLLSLHVLPAMSMVRSNACFNVEVWNVLRHLEVSARWGLYGRWSTKYNEVPELQVRHTEVSRETKGILRRVTTSTAETKDNNYAKLSIPLAKLAHSNPLVVFGDCVKQAIVYDNLIDPITESARALTTMGYDVLTYILVTGFADESRPRMKSDGTSIANWLQNLSSLTGAVFKKYALMDPAPILQYVANQLFAGNSKETIVLRELISKMTNIRPIENLSDDQVICMGGGPLLRIQAIASDTRGAYSSRLQSGNANATKRIVSALRKTNLTLPLLILLAQTRQFCIHHLENAETHLKYASNLVDECQAALFQYIEFLISGSSPEEYADILPSLSDLCLKYKIQPAIAFHIMRPALHGPILAYNIAKNEATKASKADDKLVETAQDAELRLKKALSAKRNSPPSAETALPTDKSADATNGDMITDDQQAVETTGQENGTKSQPELWLPQLRPLIESAREILSPEALRALTPEFYVTFWQLSMFDLLPPDVKVASEREKIAGFMASKNSDSQPPRDKRAADFMNHYNQDLLDEFRNQVTAREQTGLRLRKEMKYWFREGVSNPESIQHLLQECVHPRALLSPSDAEFSAFFVKQIHRLGTPNFWTFMAYDKILGEHIAALVGQLTEQESNNYGRFLRLILKDVMQWAKGDKSFAAEKPDGSVLPGFQRKFSAVPGRHRATREDLVPLTEFNLVCTKWNKNVLKGLVTCLSSGDFISIRNALLVLIQMVPVFPSSNKVGNVIIQHINDMLTREKRHDLVVMMKSYHALLNSKKSNWTGPDDTAAAPAQPAPSIAPSVPSTPTVKADLPPKPSTEQAADPSRPKPVPTGPALQLPNGPSGRSSPRSPLPFGSEPLRVATPAALNASSSDPKSSSPLVAKQADEPKPIPTIDSIPRPEVVKRIRHDAREDAVGVTTSPRPSAVPSRDSGVPTPPQGPRSALPVTLQEASRPPPTAPADRRGLPPRPPSPPRHHISGRVPPESPRGYRGRADEPSSVRQPAAVPHPSQPAAMAPPVAPSSTQVAQELRATSSRRTSDVEMAVAPPSEPKSRTRGPEATSTSSQRLPSPPSRPRTRNPSADSRTSGKAKSSDKESDDKDRRDRDGGSSRRRRDEEKEKEKDRDSERDRHRDRDREERKEERGREKEKEKERDGGRDREKEKEKEKDKEVDRDRERRKEKEPRKERERENTGSSGKLGGSSSRRDSTAADDDSSHKRRRLDDEERGGSKRASRSDAKDRHRESSRRDKDKEKEKDKDKDKEREKDRDKDRDRERDKDKDKDKDRDRDRERERRSHRKEKEGRDDEKDRDVEKDKDRDRDRDREKRSSFVESSSSGKNRVGSPPAAPRAMGPEKLSSSRAAPSELHGDRKGEESSSGRKRERADTDDHMDDANHPPPKRTRQVKIDRSRYKGE